MPKRTGHDHVITQLLGNMSMAQMLAKCSGTNERRKEDTRAVVYKERSVLKERLVQAKTQNKAINKDFFPQSLGFPHSRSASIRDSSVVPKFNETGSVGTFRGSLVYTKNTEP